MVARCEEAVQFFRAGNDLAGLPLSLIVLAIADHQFGDDARAMARFTEAADLAELGGFAWGAAAARYYQGEALAQQGDLTAAANAYQRSMETSWRLGDPWTTGAGIGGLATVAAMRGRAETAARLFGAADAFCARADAMLPVMNRGDFERVVAAARATMGRPAFERSYLAGAALNPEQAIAEAVAAGRLDGAPANPDQSEAAALTSIKLAPRELDVLRLIVEGHRDVDIAAELNLSPRTVSTYVAEMLAKFEVPSRTALAVNVIRRSLI